MAESENSIQAFGPSYIFDTNVCGDCGTLALHAKFALGGKVVYSPNDLCVRHIYEVPPTLLSCYQVRLPEGELLTPVTGLCVVPEDDLEEWLFEQILLVTLEVTIPSEGELRRIELMVRAESYDLACQIRSDMLVESVETESMEVQDLVVAMADNDDADKGFGG